MEPNQNTHGSNSNKEIKFQYLPGWTEQNFQDVSDAVYHTSIAINMLSSMYFGGEFSSYF